MAKIYRPAAKKPRQQKQTGRLVELQIDNLDHYGVGVARHQGQVVFVTGGLPGETCLVRLYEQKKKLAFGQCEQVLSRSESRVEAFCPYYDRCGGCQTQHARQEDMLRWKQQAIEALLRRISHIQQFAWAEPITSRVEGYRRKNRLAVDARNSAEIKLGYRQKEAKEIVNITHCPILVPSLSCLIAPLKQLLGSLTSPGAIGHVSLLQGKHKQQVALRTVKPLGKADCQQLVAFAERFQCDLVLEDNAGNYEIIRGQSPLLEVSCTEQLSLVAGPNDFVQVNDHVNQQMIARAMEWLAPNKDDTVLDLFCGLGNFSLPLACRAKQVLGFEGVASMVQRAAQNAQLNGISNVEFRQADLQQISDKQRTLFSQCSKVLLDPAREGAKNAVTCLASVPLSRLLYVSCNPATFARDAKILIDGGMRLVKLSLMDMFPNTAHTELMALFVRNEG